MSEELKECPLCGSAVKWCGENEADPEDNHLCHHIVCTNKQCGADFDFHLSNDDMLPDDTDVMTAEECMKPFRDECAKRFNGRTAGLMTTQTNGDELERKKFEASWLKRGGEKTDLDRFPHGHIEPGSGNVGDSYICDIVQGHWQTWQAALSSKQEES